MSAMCDRTSSAESGGHMYYFSKFSVGRARFDGGLAVPFDAIGTLRRKRNSDSDQLLVLLGDRTVAERQLVPDLKSLHGLWGELTNLRQLLEIVQ